MCHLAPGGFVKFAAWFFASILLCSPLLAEDCARFANGQKADAESVRQVERQWSKAFLSGDTDYLECLLEPDYESVWFTGEVRGRQTIIDKARAHRANPIPVPESPVPIVQIHGNTAISRSDQDVPDATSKQSRRVRFLDIFSFYDGRWHVLFTQDAVIQP
jgi:Domain of unknown function (DUF4440)